MIQKMQPNSVPLWFVLFSILHFLFDFLILYWIIFKTDEERGVFGKKKKPSKIAVIEEEEMVPLAITNQDLTPTDDMNASKKVNIPSIVISTQG